MAPNNSRPDVLIHEWDPHPTGAEPLADVGEWEHPDSRAPRAFTFIAGVGVGMLVVLLALVMVAALSGCNGPLRYENLNGPRGPESFEVPAPAWPTFGKACCPEKGG